MKISLLILSLSCLVLNSCTNSHNKDAEIIAVKVLKKPVTDVFSQSNFGKVKSSSFHLDLVVDFEKKTLKGSVNHQIVNARNVDQIIFDTKDLKIQKVILNDEIEVDFKLKESNGILGQALEIPINKKTYSVNIFYETDSLSEALMWLDPAQTLGKKKPFLFTQGEAILTRSWIPCQDAPSNRITYTADIKCDSSLLPVMSASNNFEKNDKGEYYFEMNQSVPTYLVALAVGDLVFEKIGDRTGVFAEPKILNKSIKEFSEVEKMIDAAEAIYGPYKWGRYDILVMPPSFPFGGMENPKLTFVTPTIIAGDKSLTTLIAHELAHSWSGNLVTNSTWDDFWLNEGFTVYVENRIMESLKGKDRANLLFSIRAEKFTQDINDIMAGPHPEDTKLKLNLAGRDPDDGMTSIAYVKGALFLKSIEEKVGREKFDVFVKLYFDTHNFQSVSSEEFISYLYYFLLEPNDIKFNVEEWVYEKGIPNNSIEYESDHFIQVEKFVKKINVDTRADTLYLDSLNWSTQEWVHFINEIPNNGYAKFLRSMDIVYSLKDCGNSEIMAAWYVKAIENQYKDIRSAMAEFLIKVGRRKFVKPIYKAMTKTENDLEFAKLVYNLARPNYHYITYNTIDEILNSI